MSRLEINTCLIRIKIMMMESELYLRTWDCWPAPRRRAQIPEPCTESSPVCQTWLRTCFSSFFSDLPFPCPIWSEAALEGVFFSQPSALLPCVWHGAGGHLKPRRWQKNQTNKTPKQQQTKINEKHDKNVNLGTGREKNNARIITKKTVLAAAQPRHIRYSNSCCLISELCRVPISGHKSC